MSPGETRSEATRARLLDAAAADLVDRDGLLEVGTVAARAGVSTGALYHHFKSKAGLLDALVKSFEDRLHATVIAPDFAALGDWSARERGRIEHIVDIYYGDPLASVLANLAREPEVATAEAPFVAALVGAAERNLRAAQRDREISSDIDPGITAAMIMGGIRQVLAQVLARPDPPDPAFVTEEIWRLVRDAVHPIKQGALR